jgi:hypothetical protein
MSSDPLPTHLPVASPLRSHEDLWTGLPLSLLCLPVYKANRRLIAAADSHVARALPFGIWRCRIRVYSADSPEERGQALGLRLHFGNTHRHSGGVM